MAVTIYWIGIGESEKDRNEREMWLEMGARMLKRMMHSPLGRGRLCVKSVDGPCSNSNTPNKKLAELENYLSSVLCLSRALVVVLFLLYNGLLFRSKLLLALLECTYLPLS